MTSPISIPDVHIRSYQAQDAEAFRTLNEQWIEKYFRLEEPDRQVLGDPETHILKPGGAIFIALAGDTPIGTAALIAEGEDIYELAKMAVAEQWQGRGIGRRVLEHSIREARARGGRKIWLGSNSRLKEAIHLYESVGFRHIQPEHPSPYARADVFMEMKL